MPEVSFTLNGEDVAAAGEFENALDVIRRGFDLTGAKLICGVGGCGACTVWVDGVPAETCTLDPEELAGADVVTVEGITPAGGLTSLQKALIAEDALQCGFCTPGVVVAGEAFVRGWRGQGSPARSAVEEALDRHLCRCGAYPGIVRAVQKAAAGGVDAATFSSSGRPDGVDKVTGAARFTVDVALEDALEGSLVRSTQPRALVAAIRASRALTEEGVEVVVDLLGEDREVRHWGQPIAAVAAVDAATAARARDLVEIDYTPLPSAVGMEAARAPGAPNLIGKRLFLTSNYEAGLVAASIPRTGNMRGPMGLLSKRRFTARRRVEEARRHHDPLLVEGVWTTASQSHAAAEPHAAVAVWEDSRLTVYLSTQSVRETAAKLARHFGIGRRQVRVVANHVGGAFGAKQGLPEPAVAAAELARTAGKPVRVVFDAEEELAFGGYRPGAEIELALLGRDDGPPLALTMTGYMDGGDSAGQTVVGLARISYPGPPMDLNDYDVINNGAPAKPFQAPGAPVALFALESAVDELAERAGLDPISMRKGWRPRASRGQLYEWAANHSLWKSRGQEDPSGKLRGVGVAFGSWYYGYDPATIVRVRNDDRGLIVETGGQEIGTGVTTVLAQAVADEFGVSVGDVRVQIGDSSLVHGPTTSASRTTSSVFPTTKRAASDLRIQLIAAAESQLGMRGVEGASGGIEHAGEYIPWVDLWARLPRVVASARRPRDSKVTATPIAIEGVRVGWGISDSAHVVEVQVDPERGDVEVIRAAVALSAGKVHTPAQATSQVHGALARGIGQALYEERITDAETGVVTSATYERYRFMRMSEMPEVEVEFFEEGFAHAPEGGAGIAELAITSVPAAVANAVADATGWRPKILPMTAERVRAGLATLSGSGPGQRS